jgi:hypothetical protein
MERKGTAVVTTELVESGLKKAQTTSREEQALRMRYGATVDRKAKLPQVAEPESDLADELLLIEMRLLSALKHRKAQAQAKAAPAPAKSAAKSKIVNALKSKKK